jgi:putative transcriptional regulator
VLERSIVALFAADAPPAEGAFRVLRNVYLTMHPATIDALLAEAASRYRLYAGFAAWAPRQLERELAQNAWYVLPAEESALFRERMEGLWEELVATAQGKRT